MDNSIAAYLVDYLREVGVKRIWGITGDSLNAMSDALQRQDALTWVGMRHEESAAFAAGAEAALSGELAVCAGSCGPGNLHLINGLYDCQRSRVPVLAIASHIPSNEIGSGYFQETHPQELFRECSVYCELISTAHQMPYVFETAIRRAILHRGVAVIVISGDTMLQEIPRTAAIRWQPPQLPRVTPPQAQLERLAEILNGAKNVTLLCGAGCEGARGSVLKTAGKLKSPIVHALRAKAWMEHDNPYDVGMTGLIGFASGFHAMKEADTLLILGSSFPYREFYPEDATILQVDVRPEALGVHTQIDMGMIGDIESTLDALLPLLVNHEDDTYLTRARAHYHEARRDLDALAEAGSAAIHPQYLTRLLSEKATPDAVFTCDVGTPTVWAARYLRMNGERRLLGSFTHGSMANAMPQAIGVQAAAPQRQVIALCGDGGFAMLMGDFLSLRQHRLPVKIVIYNNRSLGFVAMEQKAGGYLSDSTELDNPDFAAIAEATGIKGIRVEKASELEAAVEQFLAHDGPALLDVCTAKQELSMPPHVSIEHAKGFGLYMIRAIINGRGDELIELARQNVLR